MHSEIEPSSESDLRKYKSAIISALSIKILLSLVLGIGGCLQVNYRKGMEFFQDRKGECVDTGKRLTIKILFVFLVRMIARLDEKQYQGAVKIVKESSLPKSVRLSITRACKMRRDRHRREDVE